MIFESPFKTNRNYAKLISSPITVYNHLPPNVKLYISDTCHPQKSSDQVLDLDEKIKFCNCPKKGNTHSHDPHTAIKYFLFAENSGFFYDYPPSTGSYRAASLPEPLTDTETCDLRPRSPSVMMEHTYDEIPTNAHKPNEAVDDNFSVRFNVTKTNVQIHGMPTAKNENQFNYV